MPTAHASAQWEGGIKSGKGHFEGKSGAIKSPYTFAGRFENAGGTNPEELLASAEAACFAMALSGNLERAGSAATRLHVDAACSIEKHGDGFKITTMKLQVRGTVPGIDVAKFREVVEQTKKTCPVSMALQGNVEITAEATLEG